MLYKFMILSSRLQKRDLECYIDGPYGTPATEIFESEHAVLIAAGIGYYTPYLAMLIRITKSNIQSIIGHMI